MDVVNMENIELNEHMQWDWPKSVAISLGEFECDNKCRICPQYFNHDARPIKDKDSIMSFETLDRILDTIPKDRKLNFEVSAYTETLLIPNVPEYIKRIRDALPNAYIVMATNGHRCTGELAEALLDSGLDHLSFSLNASSPESYKWLTGKDDYKDLEQNLYNLVRIKRKGNIKTLISTHIIEIKEFAHEFEAFSNRWDGVVDWYQVRNFGNWGGLIDGSGCTPVKAYYADTRYPCLWPWYSTKILSNGDVKICFTDPYSNEKPLGNIHLDSLEDILRDSRMNDVRYKMIHGHWKGLSLCKHCMVWSLFPNIWGKNDEKHHWEMKRYWRDLWDN